MQLWIEKHKPKNLDGFVGNSKVVEKLKGFISSFKPSGKAILLCGPTGVGKSLLVEILALESGFLLTQLNANDISKEGVEEIIAASKNKTLFTKGKVILIDEIEGVSGRDRGIMEGVLKLIKESRCPVFLIASDPYLPKLRTIKENCELVKFDKIPITSITKALRDICKKECIEPEEEALKSLAKFSSGDLRSAIMDLQIVCTGRSALTQKDLESIGYREREQNIFTILQPIFHSRSVNIGRNSMQQADKDPDEVFWWVENNILLEMKTPEEISSAYNIISVADILRSRTMKQQNWRFKALASDLISSISVYKTSHTGFVMYRPPQMFKKGSAEMKEAMKNLGKALHCSSKKIKSENLSYLKAIIKRRPEIVNGLGLEKEDMDILI